MFAAAGGAGGTELFTLSGAAASKALGAMRSNVAPSSLQLTRKSDPRATIDAALNVSSPPAAESSRPRLEITNRPEEAMKGEPGFRPSFLNFRFRAGTSGSVLCNWIRQPPLLTPVLRFIVLSSRTLVGETFCSSTNENQRL